MHTLAIAIPVYKRPHLLDKCLQSIVVQLEKESDIAIFIYDDSCDETNSDVIINCQSKYNNIYHIRNESNLGICLNIQKALAESVAEYVWLVGEDDVFLYGSIPKIIGIIAETRPPFIYAEYSYVSNDYSRVNQDKVLNYSSAGFFPSMKLYEECSWAMGFIGSCVIRRDLIDEGLSDDCINTYFNHVWIVLRALFDKNIYITNEPMILNRAEGGSSTTWSDQTFTVYEGFYIVIDKLGAVYGAGARNRALVTLDQKLGCFKLRNLFFCRFNGSFDNLGMSSVIASRINLSNRIKTIVVMLFPKVIYRILKSIIRVTKFE